MNLDRAITLLKPLKTQSAEGEVTASYQPVAIVFAKARGEDRPTERMHAMANRVDDPHEFTIRYRTDVKSNWQILYEGRRYTILGSPKEIERRAFLRIHTAALSPQPATTNTALTP